MSEEDRFSVDRFIGPKSQEIIKNFSNIKQKFRVPVLKSLRQIVKEGEIRKQRSLAEEQFAMLDPAEFQERDITHTTIISEMTYGALANDFLNNFDRNFARRRKRARKYKEHMRLRNEFYLLIYNMTEPDIRLALEIIGRKP